MEAHGSPKDPQSPMTSERSPVNRFSLVLVFALVCFLVFERASVLGSFRCFMSVVEFSSRFI